MHDELLALELPEPAATRFGNLRAFQVTWQHTPAFVKVTVTGALTIGDLRAVVRQIAADAPSWLHPALLLDLRAIRTPMGVLDLLDLGEDMGCQLAALERVAVLAGRPACAGEFGARLQGLNLRVFHAEGEALGWILAAEEEGALAGA